MSSIRALFLILMSFWLCAAASVKDYMYVGVVGDIVLLKKDNITLFVNMGDFIPFTDIMVTGVYRDGARTNHGTIALQTGDYKEQINTPAVDVKYKIGSCIMIEPTVECVVVDYLFTANGDVVYALGCDRQFDVIAKSKNYTEGFPRCSEKDKTK